MPTASVGMAPGGRRFLLFPLLACCLTICGCLLRSESEVVVYTALDSEFSRPIFEDFQAETGIVVRSKFDVESTKSVGLTQALMAERDRVRCDVFWNNEILNTLRLQEQGLLDVYRSPIAESYPAMYRSADGFWSGFAARARVLIVNTDLLTEDQRPTSIHDLTDSRWRSKAALAKPLAGTTATHAACLFSIWGEDRAKQFFRDVKANDVQILSGNKQVALAVGSGQLAFGLTDTDDAIIEIEKGMPVAIVYPDQGEGQMGTLFIPNTLAVLRGCPNPAAARRLVDYLLSPQVETKLAAGRSAQIPLNPAVDTEVRVETPNTVRPLEVDFHHAAGCWDTAAEFLRDQFARAD